MRVERLSVDPEVLLLRDFVTEEEARALIAEANARFERSSVVCDDPAGCAVEQRTSSSAALPPSATVDAVQTRGKIFTRLPIAEALQVVRYEPGQEFQPHLDAFDSSKGGADAKSQYEGEQRAATILIYLDGPDEGGATIFPELGIRVRPIPRAALYWRNTRPDGSIEPRMLHGGAPVRRGVKYAANLWLRGDADPIYAYALSEDVTPPLDDAPSEAGSAAMIALGAGVGAVVGGPAGALVGVAAGWTCDVIRRKLTA